MGIAGLLPFLKKSSREANIKEFKGCTVAIDSYCWLHKGAFSCADKLALGEKTDQYVYYCMKYVNSLLSLGLKPIMVFDGARLPSKEGVERERRERREVNRKKAALLLREGRRGEARECLQRCIDITPTMALELMNACRAKGVDCIVAPYEADSQLAYLNKAGIAQVIISEDSDLVLFGCTKVMYKMDFAGNGILVDSENLAMAMDLKADLFTFEKFRYMCILSGCDYLPSLPGIGLGKANKVFKLTRQTDITLVLKKLPTTLKMSQLVVTKEYLNGFERANNTFLYQLCFDPLRRKQVPLTPYPDNVDPRDLEYAGPFMSKERALHMALGNLNHYNGTKIADFDPDTSETVRRGGLGTPSHLLSIWDPHYRPMKLSAIPTNSTPNKIQRCVSTRGQEATIKSNLPSRMHTPILTKRPRETEDPKALLDLASMYNESPLGQESKRLKCEWDDEDNDNDYEDITTTTLSESPSKSPAQGSPLQGRSRQESPTQGSPQQVQHISHNVELSTEPLPDLKKSSPKLSKNKFACVSALKKNRFELNAWQPLVKSRFFISNSKPLPKTTFFNSLSETFPSSGENSQEIKAHSKNNQDPDSDAEDKLTGNKRQLLGIHNVETNSGEMCVRTSLETMLDEKPARLAGHSPYSSFEFGKKLQMFQSSFNKDVVNTSLTSSPLSRRQFKPVTSTGSNKENGRATPVNDYLGGGDAEVCKVAGTSCSGTDDKTNSPQESILTTSAKQCSKSVELSAIVPNQSNAGSTPVGTRCRVVGLSKSGSRSATKATPSGKQVSISSFFSQFANKKK